jgi:putative ABC transport system permease protein
LTVLGVAFAVGSFITLYGVSRSVDENAQQMIDERGIHLSITRRGTAELFGGSIPQAYAPKLAAIPGVLAITGELLSLVAADGASQVIAVGWPDDSFLWKNLPLAAGRPPRLGERKFVLVGRDAASALGKSVGDTIMLLGTRFEVIGLTRYASIINRHAIVMPLDDLQELTFRPGAVTFLHVQLKHPEDSEETERISRAMEAAADVTVLTSSSVLQNDQNIGMLRAVSGAMAWVALVMGILMVLNTLLMAVLERTHELGILSAIGWSARRIMGAMVLEGLVIALIGSAAGAALGVTGCYVLSTISALARYTTVTPTPTLIMASVSAAIVLAILGSLYPAWLATRQNPGAALERI